MARCANCDAVIGKLERSYVFGQQVVCATCYVRLAGDYLNPAYAGHYVAPRQDAPSPGIAALISFFLPGVGQMYLGRVGAGFAWLLCTLLGYIMFVLPGLIIHILCVISAATSKPGQ